MTRAILLTTLLAFAAGCATDYQRELCSAEPLDNHRFVRMEFKQTGFVRPLVFNTHQWSPAPEFTLVADDGWKLVIREAAVVGYNWNPDDSHKNDPVIFSPGVGDRLVLIDPQGGEHPVKVAVGDLSPRPQHITAIQQPPATSQPRSP
jgi:hypothetical protein